MSKGTVGSDRPPAWQIAAAFAAVYLIWGSTYLAIRYAVETIPPFLMAGTRFLIAGGLLYALLRLRGVPQPTRQEWRDALVVGGLLLLGGNGLVSFSEQKVPSGIAALLVATVPLWMTLLDAARSRVRPRAGVLLGLLLGLGGIVLLVGPRELVGGSSLDWRAGLLLVAALSWAVGSLYSRGAAIPSTPLMGTAIEMLMGGALLLAAGLALGEGAQLAFDRVSSISLLGLLYLILLGSLVGFSAYTWLLRVTTPARASTYAYVNPVVAVLLGWAIAGEPLTLETLLAAGVIILAVVLITLSRTRPSVGASDEEAQPEHAEPAASPASE